MQFSRKIISNDQQVECGLQFLPLDISTQFVCRIYLQDLTVSIHKSFILCYGSALFSSEFNLLITYTLVTGPRGKKTSARPSLHYAKEHHFSSLRSVRVVCLFSVQNVRWSSHSAVLRPVSGHVMLMAWFIHVLWYFKIPCLYTFMFKKHNFFSYCMSEYCCIYLLSETLLFSTCLFKFVVANQQQFIQHLF